jgi:hypothetical protein
MQVRPRETATLAQVIDPPRAQVDGEGALVFAADADVGDAGTQWKAPPAAIAA